MVWAGCVLSWTLLLLSVLRTFELFSEYLSLFALQIYWFINSQTRHLMTSIPYSKITQEHRHSNAKSMKFDLQADCEINKLVCGLWITKRLLSLNHCTVWRVFLAWNFTESAQNTRKGCVKRAISLKCHIRQGLGCGTSLRKNKNNQVCRNA